MLELGGTFPGAYLLKRGLFLPWELSDLLDAPTLREGLRRLHPVRHAGKALEGLEMTDFAKVAVMETSLYMRNQLLRDTDWASMAHSLEVRVPLVDHVLLSAIAPLTERLPAGAGKRLLASAPVRPLPADIAERAKTGFTTPIETWMRGLAAACTLGPALDGGGRAIGTGGPWARQWSTIVAQEHGA